MAQEGFFTRVEARGKLPTKSQLATSGVDVATLHKMGLAGVKRMNPSASSPMMDPDLCGGRCDVLFLGEAPTTQDDERGKAFSGHAGRFLKSKIRAKRASFDYICRTLPPPKGLTDVHIECFRPTIEATIAEIKPRVIVGFGHRVYQWALPGIKGQLIAAHGRLFPVKIAGHECWFMPTFAPGYIQALIDKGDRLENIPADAWGEAWEADIHRAEGWDEEAFVEPEDEIKNGLVLVTSYKDIIREIEKAHDLKSFAIDLETTDLRPYTDGSDILSAAIGTYKRSVAFPLGHSGARVTRKERASIEQALSGLLTAGKSVVVQNLSFDLEWFIHRFGTQVARCSDWHDTMVQAFILDERVGGLNLDFLCRLYFGLALKGVSNVNRARLAATPLDDLLTYNALDVKYTYALYLEQRDRIKAEKLRRTYNDQGMRRVPTLVLAQAVGVPIDQAVVAEMKVEHGSALDRLAAEAAKHPDVKKFVAKYGSFSLGSQPNVGRLLVDIAGFKNLKSGNSYKTGKTVLGAVDHPIAKMVLEHRRAAKLKGTYVDRFDSTHPETYIFPDGRMHTKFNSTITATGRTSSDDPNVQNFPKRRDKAIRRIVVPPPNHWLLSSDYGQIEARVIAMLSHDKAFCQALWDDYDVHMHWAEEFIDRHPQTFRDRGSDKKAFRSDIKNQWVFPQFFGSSWKSCARSLQIPPDVAQEAAHDFWQMFSGVQQWQRRLQKFYEKNGYVQCLTGRRRRAPLSYNMVINTPVQGTASDIVVNAMDRISEQALERDLPWLQPVLNIHDDLTFIVPDKKLDEAIETISKLMCIVPYDWVNVPISIEMERGRNWAEMSEVGVFRSDKL